MKVCMFGRSLPVHSVGGMELHIETLAQELVKQGIDVTIITTEHPKKVTCEEKMGVKYHYVAEARPGKYSRRR